MRLLYATSMTFPSTRANRVQTLAVARAFYSILGDNFLLGIAKGEVDVPCAVMGVRRSIFLARRYIVLAQKGGYTHVYCREERLLVAMMLWSFLSSTKPLFIYEAHHADYVRTPLYRYMLTRCARVVAISSGVRNELIAQDVSAQKVAVAPDGVDLTQFDIAAGIDDARRALGIPMEKRVVLYAGSIDEPWKGVGTLWEAARGLGEEYLVLIVGGKPHYVEYFVKEHVPVPNARLLGYQPHERIPLYLRAADVLVLPNSGQAHISRISTSPLKLFEYLAAGKPIVASDLPSLREVASEQEVLFVQPDDPSALAAGIRMLAEEPARAAVLARAAHAKAAQYTWDARARKILDFIS